MSSGIDSLHKILKDKTRMRIILLLQEKGSLSYVDLMKALEITNTGKINYHLKILDALLSKNETGHYTLTEKGKLASRLLQEFPEENSQLYRQWVFIAIVMSIMAVLVMGFLSLEPQYIHRFFISTLIGVLIGLSFLLLVTLNKKLRAKFRGFLLNYRVRAQKPSESLYKKAQVLNAIMLATLLVFSLVIANSPSILHSQYVQYTFVGLFIVFLISAIIFVYALLKTFWKWGLILIIIGIVVAILRILTM